MAQIVNQRIDNLQDLGLVGQFGNYTFLYNSIIQEAKMKDKLIKQLEELEKQREVTLANFHRIDAVVQYIKELIKFEEQGQGNSVIAEAKPPEA